MGLCAASRASSRAQLPFPEPIHVGLRVGHLGRSSVQHQVGLYREDMATLLAEGDFTHTFVNRETGRPTPIAWDPRQALSRLIVAKNATGREHRIVSRPPRARRAHD